VSFQIQFIHKEKLCSLQAWLDWSWDRKTQMSESTLSKGVKKHVSKVGTDRNLLEVKQKTYGSGWTPRDENNWAVGQQEDSHHYSPAMESPKCRFASSRRCDSFPSLECGWTEHFTINEWGREVLRTSEWKNQQTAPKQVTPQVSTRDELQGYYAFWHHMTGQNPLTTPATSQEHVT
jgi:hypothetical protein